MSVWSEQFESVTKEPVRRIVELAEKQIANMGNGSVFLDGDQGPHDTTIDELQRAGEILLEKNIGIQVHLGGMMGPSLFIRSMPERIPREDRKL